MVIPLFGDFSSEFLLAIAFIILNGFFVATEFALVKIRGSRMQHLAETGNKRAALVLKMLEDIDGYLAATQFGITVMSLGLGWIGEPAFARFVEGFLPPDLAGQHAVAHTIAITLGFAIIIFLHVVFGELIPRGMAIRFAERFSLNTAPFLFWWRKFLRPLLLILEATAKLFLRIFGITTGTRLHEKYSEDEIRLVMQDSLGKGAMADTKLDLLDNVFDFSKKTAKHIMIARDDVVTLDLGVLIEENLAKAKHYNHTRFPLVEASLDQVVGLVNLKDILWQSESSRETMDLRKIRRDILFVPENKPLTKLLKDFQRNKIHMACVIDEFGVTVGIVTLEDVLEELVGEIQDEYDQEVSRIQLTRDGTYLIEGSTLIEEVEEKLGIRIEKQDNTTIAGAVLSKIGRLPKVGDHVDFENFSFIVKSLKGRRIYSVQAIKKAK